MKKDISIIDTPGGPQRTVPPTGGAVVRRIGALSDAVRQWIEYRAGIRPPSAPAPISAAEAEPQPPDRGAAELADDDRRARARANFRRLVRTGIFPRMDDRSL